MEGITLGVLLGAAAVLLGRKGSTRAKGAVGWAAKQAGWIAGRIQTDIADARRIAREEFERERSAATLDAGAMAGAAVGNGAVTNGAMRTAHDAAETSTNGHAHIAQ
jgi:hypothetical protein